MPAKKSEKNERIELFIPKGNSNDEPNHLISVNGKNYNLPKGKTSKVPLEVYAEYERSVRAQQKYDETVDHLIEQTKHAR